MAGAIDQGRLVPDKTVNRCAEALANAARAAGPPLLLRLWAWVCLALYVAVWSNSTTPIGQALLLRSSVSPSSELRCEKAGSG
jgi:hypothetical protein